MRAALIGYKNKVTENGVKYIGPVEPEASIVRCAFEELATGGFNTQQVLHLVWRADAAGLEVRGTWISLTLLL